MGKTELISRLPGGATAKLGPKGLTLSGSLIGPTIFFPGVDLGPWWVEMTSHYFLDPPRMPATGEAFVSLPRVTFDGNLGLRGGIDEEIGSALCKISLTQRLRPGGVEVASSKTPEWIVGYVYGKNVVSGQNILTARQRDYSALLFNLDRTQTLYVTLVTRFDFVAQVGGVIGLAPLVVGIPQWLVHSLG